MTKSTKLSLAVYGGDNGLAPYSAKYHNIDYIVEKLSLFRISDWFIIYTMQIHVNILGN